VKFASKRYNERARANTINLFVPQIPDPLNTLGSYDLGILIKLGVPTASSIY